jgi:hypothetical protein
MSIRRHYEEKENFSSLTTATYSESGNTNKYKFWAFKQY